VGVAVELQIVSPLAGDDFIKAVFVFVIAQGRIPPLWPHDLCVALP
jgi:hypothetical protein